MGNVEMTAARLKACVKRQKWVNWIFSSVQLRLYYGERLAVHFISVFLYTPL